MHQPRSRFTTVAVLLLTFLVASPGSSSGDEYAQTVFEMGVHLGIAEQGAKIGAKPELLIKHLQFAQHLASRTGHLSHRKIDAIIDKLKKTNDSRTVYSAILAYRQGLAQQVLTRSEPDQAKRPANLKCIASNWVGTWDTNWGEMKLTLSKDGILSGTYGASQHSVRGKIVPGDSCLLSGTWKHTNSTSVGQFQFRMIKPGQFKGGWNSLNAGPAEFGSTWTGTLRRKGDKSPRDPRPEEDALEG